LNSTISEGSLRSSRSARLDGVSDLEVLALADREGRVLVCHDFQTMRAIFREFTQGERLCGVLLIAQHVPRSRIRRIASV
jgi:hypothetical protein